MFVIGKNKDLAFMQLFSHQSYLCKKRSHVIQTLRKFGETIGSLEVGEVIHNSIIKNLFVLWQFVLFSLPSPLFILSKVQKSAPIFIFHYFFCMLCFCPYVFGSDFIFNFRVQNDLLFNANKMMKIVYFQLGKLCNISFF